MMSLVEQQLFGLDGLDQLLVVDRARIAGVHDDVGDGDDERVRTVWRLLGRRHDDSQYGNGLALDETGGQRAPTENCGCEPNIYTELAACARAECTRKQHSHVQSTDTHTHTRENSRDYEVTDGGAGRDRDGWHTRASALV